MLRNRLLPLQHATIQSQLQLRAKSSSVGNSSATRQSKILGKLFGSRVSGTKKRWYPSNDAATGSGSSSSGGSYQPPSVVFQASQFGKSNNNGSKQNTRRMSVLNKLFMTHITDLLATGEAAETILGRGLQVSRVKITSDFSCVNVYWMGSGDLPNDVALETELQRSSGQLRHELSQLRLMGEVPRIKFVRDKTGSNINNVEGILRKLNLKPVDEREHHEQEEHSQSHSFDVAQTARREFYGNVAMPTATTTVPQMRHDVLGLDHRLIMDKILTKMRKSKQAWEQHQQQQQQQHTYDFPSPAVSETETNNKFEAFLAKRRERKQTPERKKHRRDDDDDVNLTLSQAYDELEQRERYTQEDYILEDDKDNHKPQNYRNS
ncbi:hypothetical protein ACLKA6_005135 [Drosophila palustris]